MLCFLPFSLSLDCFCVVLVCVLRCSSISTQGWTQHVCPQSSWLVRSLAVISQHIKFTCTFILFWGSPPPPPFFKLEAVKGRMFHPDGSVEGLEQPTGLSPPIGCLLQTLGLCSCRESSFAGRGLPSHPALNKSKQQFPKAAFYDTLEKLSLLPSSLVYFSSTGVSLHLNKFSTNL